MKIDEIKCPEWLTSYNVTGTAGTTDPWASDEDDTKPSASNDQYPIANPIRETSEQESSVCISPRFERVNVLSSSQSPTIPSKPASELMPAKASSTSSIMSCASSSSSKCIAFDGGLLSDSSVGVDGSYEMATSSSKANPFDDEDDVSSEKISPTKPAKPVKPSKPVPNKPLPNANPFDDDDDVEGKVESFADVSGKPTSAKVVMSKKEHNPSAMFDSPKSVASNTASSTPASDGKSSYPYKEALKEMMLLGYSQVYTRLQLEDMKGNVRNTISKILGELRQRPEASDAQLWKPVLLARVSAWIPSGLPGDSHTVFTINCSMDVPAYSSWKVAMRFSVFKEMNESLYKPLRLAVPSGLPVSFPSSGWLAADTDARKTDRQMALDVWLRCLLQSGLAMGNPEVSAVVWKYLEVQEHLNAKTVAPAVTLGSKKTSFR